MQTKVVTIDPDNPDPSSIAAGARIIDQGGLVCFPTETVYGIAARVRDDTIDRLNDLKGRTPEKYYTLHIGRKEELARYVPSVDLRAARLIRKAWPGPLTCVFDLDSQDIEKQKSAFEDELFRNLYRDCSIGIRCPDNAVASALLNAARDPVVAPSANLSGQSPAIEPAQALRQFDGAIEMLLDAGKCRHGTSSTVVRIRPSGLQILREGVYTKEDIAKMAGLVFLFVCTGNTCRSPMAKGLWARHLSEKLACPVDELEAKGYIIESAGTMGAIGWPATPEAVEACARRGVDVSGHRSTALTADIIGRADYIYVMSQAHRQAVLSLSPKGKETCVLMLGENDIPDPIGQGQEVYDACAETIEIAVKKRICEILK